MCVYIPIYSTVDKISKNILQLDESAFFRTQCYITNICYFKYLLSFDFWMAKPIFSTAQSNIKPNYIFSPTLKLVITLLRLTHLAIRKSYLVIIWPNSHEKLTKM